jgi:hypothetical protein
MHRVVQLAQNGRLYTFTVEREGRFEFWRVETPASPPFRSPSMVHGNEQPGFFRMLAEYSDDPVHWP